MDNSALPGLKTIRHIRPAVWEEIREEKTLEFHPRLYDDANVSTRCLDESNDDRTKENFAGYSKISTEKGRVDDPISVRVRSYIFCPVKISLLCPPVHLPQFPPKTKKKEKKKERKKERKNFLYSVLFLLLLFFFFLFLSNRFWLECHLCLCIVLSVPPKITPFSFARDLNVGHRTSVQCVVVTGDLPLTFTWLKDNVPIETIRTSQDTPSSGHSRVQAPAGAGDPIKGPKRGPKVDLGQAEQSPRKAITVRQYDAFTSALSISTIAPAHNGTYTCRVANGAATVAHSALLHVNGKRTPLVYLFRSRSRSHDRGGPRFFLSFVSFLCHFLPRFHPPIFCCCCIVSRRIDLDVFACIDTSRVITPIKLPRHRGYVLR